MCFLLEFTKNVDDLKRVIHGRRRRVEKYRIQIMSAKILKTLSETLPHLVFQLGLGVVWNSLWILAGREGEFGLDEEVFAFADWGLRDCFADEILAVMSWLTCCVNGAEAGL